VAVFSDEQIKKFGLQNDEWAIREAFRLKNFVHNLTGFADALYEECQNTQGTSAWALELQPPEWRKTVEDWDHTAIFEIDFASLLGPLSPSTLPREKRFRIAYEGGVTQVSAVSDHMRRIILGQPPANVTVVTERPPSSRKTPPLRVLFRGGFFDTDIVYKAWEEDRARLALGLANWTLLLWSTNWTGELCCCVIEFVKLSTAASNAPVGAYSNIRTASQL
jgi:hypothetical protein